MTEIVSLPIEHWDQACSPQQQDTAVQALEGGSVVLLPHLAFPLDDTERRFLDPRLADAGKNISLNPANGALQGSRDSLEPLRGMVERYAKCSATLLRRLLPSYMPTIQTGRTSFRPVEIEGRTTSWRKDDTRLHVDSFPSSPTQGRRILRLFTNVHPEGRPRTWRLGDSFEGVARHYLPSLHRPMWGTSAMLQALGITKSRRSAYDHFMLQLHDQMKADAAYQVNAPQHTQQFVPGSSWLVYTDQVSHAAMAGQHLFEQTFYLPIEGMRDAATSPLRVLERLLKRELV
ncbi:MAG: 3-deoxy-D-manno-oct-2-ulosonic acid (Kdo) hydroxylase [Burkholderiales bacterium PBB1]|nr:MAG: 3-deoxy-D-manno-oct-2-ulosonic acid (Kdo) hydroxylase [Burkholderiales bacterium PBB1]